MAGCDRPGSERLFALASLVEDALEQEFEHARSESDVPQGQARLIESMRYSLLTPGKRLRPLLLLTTIEAVGGTADRYISFAIGIEMIHAYSLIHDDLPAMDDDDMRRGRPTNHIVYGEGLAILAGDGLLTEAFVAMLEPVATEKGTLDPTVQLAVARDVARAAGYEGMVGGQAADLLAEGQEPDEELLRSIHRRKTGALIRASVLGGTVLAGATEEATTALARFADHYGLAFQIADDVKDEIAPTEISGKRRGGDRAAGKMTYPALFGVDRSIAVCREELDRALTAIADFGTRADTLARLARESVAVALDTEEG